MSRVFYRMISPPNMQDGAPCGSVEIRLVAASAPAYHALAATREEHYEREVAGLQAQVHHLQAMVNRLRERHAETDYYKPGSVWTTSGYVFLPDGKAE